MDFKQIQEVANRIRVMPGPACIYELAGSDHRVTGEVAGREPQQVGTPITPDSWNHVEYCRFKDWNICTPDHNNPICNLKCSQLLEMAL